MQEMESIHLFGIVASEAQSPTMMEYGFSALLPNGFDVLMT